MPSALFPPDRKRSCTRLLKPQPRGSPTPIRRIRPVDDGAKTEDEPNRSRPAIGARRTALERGTSTSPQPGGNDGEAMPKVHVSPHGRRAPRYCREIVG